MEGKSLTISFAKRENLGSGRRSLDPGETETKGDSKVHRKTLPTLEFCVRWTQWEEFKNVPRQKRLEVQQPHLFNSQSTGRAVLPRRSTFSLWPAAEGQSVGTGAPLHCYKGTQGRGDTETNVVVPVEATYWESVRCQHCAGHCMHINYLIYSSPLDHLIKSIRNYFLIF